MTLRVIADFDLCEANAVCVGIAPDVFEVDDNDFLNILVSEVAPDREAAVREAVKRCPKAALSLQED